MQGNNMNRLLNEQIIKNAQHPPMLTKKNDTEKVQITNLR